MCGRVVTRVHQTGESGFDPCVAGWLLGYIRLGKVGFDPCVAGWLLGYIRLGKVGFDPCVAGWLLGYQTGESGF